MFGSRLSAASRRSPATVPPPQRVDRALLQDKTRAVAIVPIVDKDGTAVGLLEVANKTVETGPDREIVPFDHADLRVLMMCAAHVDSAVSRIG